jgi:hypothetical protein
MLHGVVKIQRCRASGKRSSASRQIHTAPSAISRALAAWPSPRRRASA